MFPMFGGRPGMGFGFGFVPPRGSRGPPPGFFNGLPRGSPRCHPGPHQRPPILLFTYAGNRTPHSTPFSSLFRMSVLHIINVSRCAVPPPHICRTMNRLNPECLRAVFRSPRLRELYQDGLRRLEDAVRRGGGGFAVGGTCGSGTHRSVSVVERMAGWLRNRGFEVQVRHLDIRTPRLQMER